MITIDVDVAALARTRIASSAVWEVTASLAVLFRAQPPVLHARLHAELRDLVRERTPERVGFDVRLLADVARAPDGWVPRALTPAPVTAHLTAADQLALVAATPADVAADDLAALRSAYPDRYPSWTPTEYADRLAAALTGYWSALLEPVWERVLAIQDADVAHHVNVLAAEGLAATLPGMHSDISLSGDVIEIRGQGPRQAPTARPACFLILGLSSGIFAARKRGSGHRSDRDDPHRRHAHRGREHRRGRALQRHRPARPAELRNRGPHARERPDRTRPGWTSR